MNIEWNATNYTNHFSFVHKYGEDVLKLIDAPAGSRVLDLGGSYQKAAGAWLSGAGNGCIVGNAACSAAKLSGNPV